MDTAERLSLLRSTEFFRDASEPIIGLFAAGGTVVELAAGAVLFEAGETGDAMYIVAEGRLEIYLRDVTLDESGRGACLGELALFTEEVRVASVRGADASLLFMISRALFERVLNAHPEVLTLGMFRELMTKLKSSIRVRVAQHASARRLEEAFARCVSHSVMKAILSTENPRALLEGREIEATVLFADVRDFTARSEKLPAAAIIRQLNIYLSTMADVILGFGGTLDKFLGDGIMAYFGAPLAGTEDELKAVRCALEMQRQVTLLNAGALAEWPMIMGVGIATGTVVAGCVGNERRMEYTVIGDVVNLASRMEGLTKAYRASLLVSASTARRLDGLETREVDRVRVKGKRVTTSIYDVPTGAGADILRARYEEAASAYFDGRFAQAAAAFAALSRAFPEDGPTATMATRCERFGVNPPARWEGVFDFTEK